jgi:hypothetical protein
MTRHPYTVVDEHTFHPPNGNPFTIHQRRDGRIIIAGNVTISRHGHAFEIIPEPKPQP